MRRLFAGFESKAPGPRGSAVLAVLLGLMLWSPELSGQLEPIRASYEVIPGQPLILSVRPVDGNRPKPRVELRFPDGRSVEGEVAAVRLLPPVPDGRGWIDPGSRWEVVAPSEAGRDDPGLAWFVLADLPDGVIGQELWLDGRPISLRWLPRPRLLAARLGFSPEPGGAGPLADPWQSPIPESWRQRPDLASALKPAAEDPIRRWRARLCLDGLHPDHDRGLGPITPDLLASGLVEASARVTPLAGRLLDVVAGQNEARWRIGLARLWAADPSLSLRIRYALAGAAEFRVGETMEDRVVAPVWTADSRRADVLLEILLNDSHSEAERTTRAERWLAETQAGVVWAIDDGAAERSGLFGAMSLRAGDTTAIEWLGGDAIPRPVLLTTRQMAYLRSAAPRAGASHFGVRIGGTDYRVAIEPRALRAEPPGVVIGAFRPEFTMRAWLGAGEAAGHAPREAASGLLSHRPAGGGSPSGWRLLLRLDGVVEPERDELRIWIGPFGRTKAVVTVTPAGGLDVQRFDRAGSEIGDPGLIAANLDGQTARLELVLPSGSVGSDGMMHLALEWVDGRGSRSSWPREMLPWQIEPGRRVIDTATWMGGLATD